MRTNARATYKPGHDHHGIVEEDIEGQPGGRPSAGAHLREPAPQRSAQGPATARNPIKRAPRRSKKIHPSKHHSAMLGSSKRTPPEGEKILPVNAHLRVSLGD